MRDPNTVIYYAHKSLRKNGGYSYLTANPKRWWLELFGFDDPIVKVSVRERLPTDPPSTYWGWLETTDDHYTHVWPTEDTFEMCFPYGSKDDVARGRGRKVNLIVEELPEEAPTQETADGPR